MSAIRVRALAAAALPAGMLTVVGLLLSSAASVRAADGPAAHAAGCAPRGGWHFICGIDSPEDLVAVGATSWVITSGIAPHGGLYLLRADRGLWKEEFPSDDVSARLDAARFGHCSGPPDAAKVSMLGLGIRPDPRAPQMADVGPTDFTLYGVDAGREAIEVFDVALHPTPSFGGGAPVIPPPRLTWVGCVMLPHGVHGAGVTATRSGTIYASVMRRPGQSTGAVYVWKPGDAGFHELSGMELPGDAGLAISADDHILYVVASEAMRVDAFSLADPSHPMRTAQLHGFYPDNLHWDGGDLVTAGMRSGGGGGCQGGDEPMSPRCHRGYVAARIDPTDMSVTVIAQGGPNPAYGNISMALPVAHHLWLGTFHSEGLAYRPM